MKKSIFLLLCVLFALKSQAQTVSIQNDSEKKDQILSMEFAQWSFGSKYWYRLLHKNYSGAKGFLKINFDEGKSNIKRMMYERTAMLAAQEMRKKDSEAEMNQIDSIMRIELENQIDRTVDLMWDDYKDDFARLKGRITENLSYVIEKSKGKWNHRVADIESQYGIVCDNIDYIHKTGVGFELENSKRQKAYDDAKEELNNILRKSNKLAYAAGIMF